MPMHSLIFINAQGGIIYSKYFGDLVYTSNMKSLFEDKLFKLTNPNWGRISSTPGCLIIEDVIIVHQAIGDMIVFAAGTDDVDETIRKTISVRSLFFL